MTNEILKLSEKLKELRAQKDAIDVEWKAVNKDIEAVEQKMIDLMVDSEVPSFKHKGNGFSLVTQSYPGAESDRKEELYGELKKRGYEHLFTVNTQTLSSTIKELISQNDDVLPDWLDGLVRTYEKTSIRINKNMLIPLTPHKWL